MSKIKSVQLIPFGVPIRKFADAHTGFSVSNAAWDTNSMAHIRNNIGITLMADESIWTPQDAIKISEYGAADLLNIKIAKSWGLQLPSEFTELPVLKKNVLKHNMEIIDGCLKVPDKPGFGVELDEDVLNECRYYKL